MIIRIFFMVGILLGIPTFSFAGPVQEWVQDKIVQKAETQLQNQVDQGLKQIAPGAVMNRRADAAEDVTSSSYGDLSCTERQAKVQGQMEWGIKLTRRRVTALYTDVAYGADPAQKLDVYAEGRLRSAPIILMIHGGGWCIGDKAMAKVVVNKVKRWVPKGFIFVSANYRMLPHTPVEGQVRDVAAALAYVQQHAASWGGDPDKVILMGHSAGGHLVSLLNSDPDLVTLVGASPWLGTIALDSGAMNVPAIMGAKHYGLYDDPFGKNKERWRDLSPLHRIKANALPWLGVCSLRRSDSCPAHDQYAVALGKMRKTAFVVKRNLGHGAINGDLGADEDYTKMVEIFMSALHPDMTRLLRY